MENLSELAELCSNLVALHQLQAEDIRDCRRWHPRQLLRGEQVGGPTVATHFHCAGDLEVLGIRKKIEHLCRRRHLRGPGLL